MTRRPWFQCPVTRSPLWLSSVVERYDNQTVCFGSTRRQSLHCGYSIVSHTFSPLCVEQLEQMFHWVGNGSHFGTSNSPRKWEDLWTWPRAPLFKSQFKGAVLKSVQLRPSEKNRGPRENLLFETWTESTYICKFRCFLFELSCFMTGNTPKKPSPYFFLMVSVGPGSPIPYMPSYLSSELPGKLLNFSPVWFVRSSFRGVGRIAI